MAWKSRTVFGWAPRCSVGSTVIGPCDISPTIAVGKQWVAVSLSRLMIGWRVNRAISSLYLSTHQSLQFTIARMTSRSLKNESTVMNSGMKPSLKSWKTLEVNPPALNIRAGEVCVIAQGDWSGAVVRVTSLTVSMALCCHLRG